MSTPSPVFSKSSASDVVQKSINTIRTLCMDAVQQANSGHPGTPMGMAPVTYTLWQEFLRFDPADPIWPNRDRFVLSAGHASTLLYAMLHLTGVKAVNAKYENLGELSVKLDDLKKFRQLDSKCPGHPEYRWTSGVETTTGPLGQGVATSVGMAIASKWLGARYNKPGQTLFDFRTYALAGDGCMMEGVSSEAASLAGHLKLSNLCWIYDNNGITIEGSTKLAFTEDVAARFKAYHWNVIHVTDANDLGALRKAFAAFQATTDKPTLIIVDSHIAYGSPHKQDTAGAHGEPLGPDEVKATKEAYGWPGDAQFLVPDDVIENFKGGIGKRGASDRAAWMDLFKKYEAAEPALAAELKAMNNRDLPAGWDKDLPVFPPDAKGMGGRDSSGKVLNAIAKNYPWLLGGAADLAPSTKTRLTFDGAGDFEAGSYNGRNFHFGVREHAMGSILNGLAVSKLRPFGAGFMIFSDYGRNPIRLAAIMELSVIYVFTHDSIGVGEDGPTHQPIEQLISLRAIPGLIDLRPGDANEVAEAWRVTLNTPREPVVLILSRQPMATLDRTKYGAASGVAKGGYILSEAPGGKPEVLLIATGSELGLALSAQDELTKKGVKARVISLPSWQLFSKQSQAYRDSVLPPEITARVSIEQASTFGWERFVGLTGASIGMSSFGASAPLKELQKKFGFTTENVVNAALKQIGKA
jgi:transketolase